MIWISNKYDGLIGACFGDYAIHFGVRPSAWVWGHKFDMRGAAIREFGLGPLIKLVRFEGKT